MLIWWTSLSVMMKVVWGVTLAASLIFVIQTIMTFLGADIGSDADFDMDGADFSTLDSGMNLYTFRNLVNFFLGFGWSVILLQKSIPSTGLLMLVSALVGILLVVLVMSLFRLLAKMQQSGNIDVYKSAEGCTGKVYLTIPGERAGEGKVQITISGSIREYAALTDGPEIKTGTAIKVTEVVNPSTLLVEELNSLII